MYAKRALLYGDKSTDPERNEAARLFISEEKFGEALEFLEITKDGECLRQVEEAAFEKADTFLMLRIEKIRGKPYGAEAWRRSAKQAVRLEKFHDAYRCLLRAEDEEGAEAIRAKHMPDFHPFHPEGK